jgi:Family of unknown function (DUF6370)
MKVLVKLGVVAAVVLGLSGVAAAADDVKTLTGKVVCGKCSLKKEAGCQNVFVAEDGAEYYLSKTEAADKFGHVCKGEKTAKATGTVTEKDGKKWLTASAMEEAKTN